MGRLRTRDFDLAPGFRRIDGRVYFQPTTLIERKAISLNGRISALPEDVSLVYFMRAAGRRVKIGFTSSKRLLRHRVHNVKTSSPVRVRLLGAVVGTFEDEQRAHRLLVEYHEQGEWFRINEAVTSFILNAIASGRIPDKL